MKQGSKVVHVALRDKVNLKGKDLPKMLFDGMESCPGIEMALMPFGVACRARWKGEDLEFGVPFSQVACFTVDDAKE